MHLDLFKKLAEECSHFKFKPRLHFSGLGEPLVYKSFVQVMELCQAYDLPWSVTTNGLALRKHIDSFIAHGCKGINLSVHGIGKDHDQIVGTHGAFDIVKESLVILEARKQDKRAQKPRVAVNCVVNNQNVLNLEKIYNEFKAWPINSVTFQHVSFSKDECLNGADFTITEPHKLDHLKLFIRKMNSESLDVPVHFFPHLKEKMLVPYYTDPDFPAKVQCFLPWLSLRIYPDGAVKMCEKEFGKLQSSPIKELMNNAKALQFRNSVKNGQFNTPVCFRCCHRAYNLDSM
jgi:sulfatase maturation enzyme AslB (radical SAM superfamily)